MTPDILQTKLGSLLIRRAEPADVPAFYAVLCNVSQWLIESGSSQWIEGAHDHNSAFIDSLVQQGNCSVVEHDGYIIATVRVAWALPHYWHIHPPDMGYISTLYVHRDYARYGIGSALLEWAETFIHQQHKSTACLDAYAGSSILCQYYEARGYDFIGEVQTYTDYFQRLYQKRVE